MEAQDTRVVSSWKHRPVIDWLVDFLVDLEPEEWACLISFEEGIVLLLLDTLGSHIQIVPSLPPVAKTSA